MATKLTVAWCVAVLLLCSMIAWALLPAGSLVRRAYSIMEASDRLPEDDIAQAARNRADRLVSGASLWEESDWVREAVGTARAAGSSFVAPVLRRADNYSVRRATVDRIREMLQTCDMGLARMGEVVGAELDVTCFGPRGATSLWRFEVTEPTWITVELGSSSFNPYLALTNESGRTIAADDNGGTGVDARISLGVAPGAYTIRVSANRAGRIGAYELSVDRVDLDAGVRVAVGDSVLATGPARAYELELTSSAGHLIRGPGNSALWMGLEVTSLDGVSILFPAPDRQLVRLMTRGTVRGRPFIAISGPVPSRGRPIVFGETVVDTLGRDESMVVLEFFVPDDRLVAIELRPADTHVQPADFDAFLLGSGSLIRRSWGFTEQLTMGHYRVVLTRASLGIPDDLPFEATISCLAQVLPAQLDAESVWSGADECSPERTGETIWTLDTDVETVIELEWEGEGSTRIIAEGHRPQATLTVLGSEGAQVFASGSASERIRVLDRGSAKLYFESQVEAAVAASRRGDSPTVVGVGRAPVTVEVAGRWTANRFGWRVLYAERDAEGGSCVVMLHEDLTDAIADWGPYLLGPCGFFATYGWPGEELMTWLEGGGLDFATAPTQNVRLLYVNSSADRSLLGAVDFWGFEPEVEACLEGSRERCEGMWDTASSGRRQIYGPQLQLRTWYDDRRGVAYGHQGSLLADLVAEFGEASFAQFWRSELPVGEAFANAFGVSRAEWTYRWAKERLGSRTSRGSMALDGLLSLLTVLLLAGVASGVSHRRSVG